MPFLIIKGLDSTILGNSKQKITDLTSGFRYGYPQCISDLNGLLALHATCGKALFLLSVKGTGFFFFFFFFFFAYNNI